jgi:tRNA(adenine34) deaminase
MSQNALNGFGAYRKARELFDMVVQDMEALKNDPRCFRLVGQQVGSADSVCANIEEGYGRLSRAEYVRFLDIARGSARETKGRYERMKCWLDERLLDERIRLADEVIAILTASIQTLRRDMRGNPGENTSLREDSPAYGSEEPEPPPPSPLPPRPSFLDPPSSTLDPPSSTLDPPSSTLSPPDSHFMGEALRQALRARKAEEVPVGAVVVRDGRIIARAFNQVELLKDATAHAEMLALTQAEAAVGDWRLTDCTLYATKEPCPMCAGAIVHARLARVVFGAADPKAGAAGSALNLVCFPGLNHQCAITGGVREPECRTLLRKFFAEQRRLKTSNREPGKAM